MNLFESIAGLLAQLSDPQLQPFACTAGRFKLRLQLIFDVGFRYRVGDRRSLVPAKGSILNLFDIAAAKPQNLQITLEDTQRLPRQFVVGYRRLGIV